MRLRRMPTIEALGRCKRWLPVVALAACLMSCVYSGGVDGPVLTWPRPEDVYDPSNAIVSGNMVYDEDAGCLYLGSSNSTHLRPVVWPFGATWQADPPAVKLRGQLIEPGMSVKGRGSETSIILYIKNVFGDAVADAAKACADHVDTEQIAFFNVGSEVDLEP